SVAQPALPPETARSVRFDGSVELSPSERNAFREIARALGANAERNGQESVAPVAPVAPPAAAKTPAAPAAEAANIAQPAAPAVQPFESLLDRLDAAVLVTRGGVPAYANRTFLETLGYSDIDHFHAAGGVEHMFKDRKPEALAGAADGGAIPLVAHDGNVLTLEGRLQSIDWAGEPATLMTFRQARTQELTAKIQALELDARKAESQARELHAILDTATDGVAIIDSEGRILSLNKSGQALFGYEPNEIAGEKFTLLLARESHSVAFDYLDGLKNDGVRSVLNDGREVTGQARRGGAIPMYMTLGRLGAGADTRFCAVMRDLTPWKKVERDLSEARRQAEHTSALKSDFLAKISHEIRTPLNAILGFAEVIMDERFGPVGNERYKDYLKDIHTSGNHVLSLVNDLLDLSKIEAGKLDLNFAAVDANKIVNESVSIMQAQAIRERVIVRLSLAPGLPNIVADERSLRQIVLNILSNAVKFNQPGGQVIVSTALTDAGYAVIRVRDTGIGMNEQEIEAAIEPFRRITTARPTTGTGLGLPLTKALAEANRAAFSIRSRKGEGTLVEIAFPPTRVLAE
ncbi:MAG: PAS domain S-box protein, partial [Alphaproteobacteria bacterium]|nr:PAS domain S-box protein [Alphaproteobacteria bacterium]